MVETEKTEKKCGRMVFDLQPETTHYVGLPQNELTPGRHAYFGPSQQLSIGQ